MYVYDPLQMQTRKSPNKGEMCVWCQMQYISVEYQIK